jgi:SpoVK/Ycf46/Vps4 family AAA+-type ATPase
MIEVEDIVRVQVDEIMREELENLKIALDKDKGKKGKKGKGGKKGKKGKGGKKGKKGKKSKDLTADRTPESLYQELIKQGIIKKPDPNTTLNSIVGEYSYLGTTLQSMGKEGQPSIWDIKQAVTLHSILPLGSEQVRNSAPLTKSILIAGPEGCGKRMLIDAICNELGANLFDLTCDNIAGKYPGKSGLNLLLHMVFKVTYLSLKK